MPASSPFSPPPAGFFAEAVSAQTVPAPVSQAKTPAPKKTRTTPRKTRHKRAAHRAVQNANFVEGILIQDLSGKTLKSARQGEAIFNPASNTKLATTLMVLRQFADPNFTFVTEVRTTGAVDDKGELSGDLYVDGRYMLFGDRQAHELADLLDKRGIVSVKGDIYVSPNFSMNLEGSGWRRRTVAENPRSRIQPQSHRLQLPCQRSAGDHPRGVERGLAAGELT